MSGCATEVGVGLCTHNVSEIGKVENRKSGRGKPHVSVM